MSLATQPRPRASLDLRTAVAMLAVASAVVLVPWTIYLAGSLPSVYVTGTWAGTWVGYDVVLLLALAATGALGMRRHPWFAPAAAASATLLGADAWFDVMTSTGTDRWVAIATAALVELPLAAVLMRTAGRSLAPARSEE